MTHLTLTRWRRWPLNLGDNLSLPKEEQAYIEVKMGLSKAQLKGLDERLQQLPDDDTQALEQLTGVLEEVVRLGRVALFVDGEAIDSVRKLAALMFADAARQMLIEVTGAVQYTNTVQGSRDLFFERLSGGASGTAARPA